MLGKISAVAILGTRPIVILRSPIHHVFRRICTFAFLLGALTTAASAQTLAIGVKGGVPLLDAFEQNTPPPMLTLNPSFFFHYTFSTKRYTVGPAVDVSLPLKLRFEANALYTRLDYDSTVRGVDTVTTSATRANSWQFPLLLKKEIPVGPVQPFGDIGYALRHVSGTSHIVNIVIPAFITDQTVDSPELVHSWVNGFVVGGGLAFHSGPLKFSPEVRYTRCADPNFRCPRNPGSCNGSFQSNLNQADFLLGIAWSRF